MAQIPLRAESACANPIGRREVLAALAVSQFATPVLASVAVSMPAAALVPDDVPFWTALAEFKSLDRELIALMEEALPNRALAKDVWGRFKIPFEDAMRKVVLATVSTPCALLQKLEALAGDVAFDTGDDQYPDFWACLMRDVRGMAA